MTGYVPTTGQVREAHIVNKGQWRQSAGRGFDAWLDQVKAEARREGQAEALRQAAYVAGDVAPDGMGGNDWFPSERSDHVAAWLGYRADRIESGAGQ